LTRGQRAKAAVIAAVASPAISLLCRTLKWRIDGDQHFDEIRRAGRQPILALWHGRILPGLFYLRHRGIVVITSQNFDGEWIAGIIRRFGYGTARGSTSRGGARALVQLRRDLAAGKPAAFTVDGPRGPARVAQAGAVFLAGATGQPILPFHIESSAAWTMNSWDHTQVPKPYARIGVAIGVPIVVTDTSETTIEAKRVELESSLADLETRSRQLIT